MKMNSKNNMKGILSQEIWGPCIPRKMTDEERFKYHNMKPNTYEFREDVKAKAEGIEAIPEVVNGKEVVAMGLKGEKAIRV